MQKRLNNTHNICWYIKHRAYANLCAILKDYCKWREIYTNMPCISSVLDMTLNIRSKYPTVAILNRKCRRLFKYIKWLVSKKWDLWRKYFKLGTVRISHINLIIFVIHPDFQWLKSLQNLTLATCGEDPAYTGVYLKNGCNMNCLHPID